MSGFLSSTTAMTICKVNSTVNFTLNALRAHAFTPDIDADGRRLGWVSLGDPLDTDGFALASVDGRYCGFAFRLDTRKAVQGRYPAPACGSRAGRTGFRQKGRQHAQKGIEGSHHRQTDRQSGICVVCH